MGGGGGSSGAVSYPWYQEMSHFVLLNMAGNVAPIKCITGVLNETLGQYPSWTNIDIDNLMCGIGYDDTSFPSVFDMFGRFMAGLDIEVLWSQIYEENVQGPEMGDIVKRIAEDLSYDMETEIYPRFHAGMRDINAVQSSAFVNGRAILETRRQKLVAGAAADTRMKALLLTNDRWAKHLDWNKSVATGYAELAKLYYSAKFDSEGMNFEMIGKQRLWDIRLFEYIRSFLGSLQGGGPVPGGEEVSQAAKSISGTMGGAAAGAMIGAQMGGSSGGPYGAVIGAVVGLAASFF